MNQCRAYTLAVIMLVTTYEARDILLFGRCYPQSSRIVVKINLVNRLSCPRTEQKNPTSKRPKPSLRCRLSSQQCAHAIVEAKTPRFTHAIHYSPFATLHYLHKSALLLLLSLPPCPLFQLPALPGRGTSSPPPLRPVPPLCAP